MTLFKISLVEDIRRLELDNEEGQTTPSFKTLHRTVRKLFGDALPQNFVLRFLDTDGDNCSITNDKELQEALLNGMRGHPRPFLRVTVHPPFAKSLPVLGAPTSALPTSNVSEKTASVENKEVIEEQGFHHFGRRGGCQRWRMHCAARQGHPLGNPDSTSTTSPSEVTENKCEEWRRRRGDWHRFHGGWKGHALGNPDSTSTTTSPSEGTENKCGEWRRRRGGCHGGWKGNALGTPTTEDNSTSNEHGCRRRGGRRGGCHGGWEGKGHRWGPRFATDLSLPSGTKINQGETFQKSWRLTNECSVAWPNDTCIIYHRGEHLIEKEVPLGREVAAGESIDVTLDLKAPQQLGRCFAVWRLSSKTLGVGFRFGIRLRADIDVVGAEPSSQVPSIISLEPISSPSVVEATIIEIDTKTTTPVPSAPVEEPIVVVSPTQPIDSDLEMKVNLLVGMGFTDVDANRAALLKRGKNVVRAVNDLLGL